MGLPSSSSLTHRLARHAAARADAVALSVHDGESLTFGSWERRSNAFARGLTRRGITAGQPVALVFDNRSWTEFAVAYAGVLKIGAVAVPLAPRLNSRDLLRLLDHSQANTVITQQDTAAGAVGRWLGRPADLEGGEEEEPLVAPAAAVGPNEVLYPGPAMSRPRPISRPSGFPRRAPLAAEPGSVLVHAFPFGTPAAQDALWLPLCVAGAQATVIVPTEPERVWDLVAELAATHLGLSPALGRSLATMLERCGDVPQHLLSLRRVVLAFHASPPLLDRIGHHLPKTAVVCAQATRRHAHYGDDSVHDVPLALAQEPMVWHEQLVPASFNLPPLVRSLRGNLDVTALEASLNEIVRRHEPLRTTFEMVEGEAVQRIRRANELTLGLSDLTGVDPEAAESEISRLLDEATNSPVDLVLGPLFTPRLVRLSTEEHLLIVPVHHTVWDDWSIAVFHRELSTLYAAFSSAQPSPLAHLPVEFREFCLGQRRRLDGPGGASEMPYWHRELAGAALSTQLPLTDPDLPLGASLPVARPVSLLLPPTLAAQVAALARRLRATSFMTVLACFQVVLHRWTEQDDLLVATVVAGRNRTELEGLIGCFAKKVPLRLRLVGDPSFTELVSQARDIVFGALAHQEAPYEEVLQQVLGPAASAHGVAPVTAVMLQGLSAPKPKLNLPGLRASWFDSTRLAAKRSHFASDPKDSARTAAADAPPWGAGMYLGTFMNASIIEGDEGLQVIARGVFHRPAGELLLEHLRVVVTNVVAEPETAVSKLMADLPEVPCRREALPGVSFRGFRIEPGRIEAVLNRCPDVAESLVALLPDGSGDPRLVGWVVPAAGARLAVAGLRAWLWSELPGYIWPAQWIEVPALPPKALAASAASEIADPSPTTLPTPEEVLLRSTWAGSLDAECIGDSGNYWRRFSFLEAVDGLVQDGVAITSRQIARNRTVETLAAAMVAEQRSPRT